MTFRAPRNNGTLLNVLTDEQIHDAVMLAGGTSNLAELMGVDESAVWNRLPADDRAATVPSARHPQ